jgi:hypothetical protein
MELFGTYKRMGYTFCNDDLMVYFLCDCKDPLFPWPSGMALFSNGNDIKMKAKESFEKGVFFDFEEKRTHLLIGRMLNIERS